MPRGSSLAGRSCFARGIAGRKAVRGRSRAAPCRAQLRICRRLPYTPLTGQNLDQLAALKPEMLAVMHGSSFTEDCARALDELHVAFREVFGAQN
jgi:hypothetical protein